ncbi:MAG TPA: GH92 family glycosyl hydrolase, partial [Candidatus Acidoferrales bacterium]|nr:GH92 family glycosyl hydrolase [Candidatus Acidoferrales bacterium]
MPALHGSPLADVNPFVGTARSSVVNGVPSGVSGDTFPGAVVPFSEVQWSPDTPTAENPAGYNYADNQLLGFSLTHFSGAGCANSGLFRFLPTVGDDGSTPPTFDHADEEAHPGEYHVRLTNGIQVDLTTTLRGGLGRFTFPPGSAPTVVFDATTTYPFPLKDVDALQVIDDHTVSGSETTGNFCGTVVGYHMYVSAQFDTPFTVVPSDSPTQVRLHFSNPPEGTVRLRVALSPVSTTNAAANLQAEIPDWDWETVRSAAADRWSELLGRVNVTGGSTRQRRVFFTALYHSLIHPSTFSDVNGEYPGFDKMIHHVDAGHVHYHTFSGWDIYRSQVQLLSALVPEIAHDLMATLLDNAELGGGGFDQWSMGNIETHTTLGDPGSVIVSNFDAFQIGGVDPAAVLAVMRRAALDPNTTSDIYPLRPHLQEYLGTGYVWRDVSRTLEYAISDAAIAAYAHRHGDPDLEQVTRSHAANWQNLFNPATGYLQPRNKDGSWSTWTGPTSTVGYSEGNSAQYTWMVPQDYAGLITSLGGPEVAVGRLDSLFEKLNAGLTEPNFYIGNEPEFAVPWAYIWANAPARTQDVVRRIIDGEFDDTPAGLPGNDDLGAMSSWLVWSALGMFPTLPGQDVLTLNTPLFPSATIDLP